MKLTELHPKFIRYETRPTEVDMVVGDHDTWRARGCPTEHRVEPRVHIIFVDTLSEAQGIWFDCPKCHPKGHGLDISFDGRGVLPEQGTQNKGQPVRWGVTGDSFENLTLTPSVQVVDGCGWHGWVKEGDAT